jgi:hypothetical protein
VRDDPEWSSILRFHNTTGCVLIPMTAVFWDHGLSIMQTGVLATRDDWSLIVQQILQISDLLIGFAG